MTIHDTIDHKHNVERDGEGSNEMANSHIFISLTLELLSYARFIYWLSLVSYCSTMRGGSKGQVHYQKIPRKDYLLSPASLLRIDLLISSLSLIPATPTPPQPCHTLHSNCENERYITNGIDYVLCTKCQEHFVMQKKKKKKRLKTTKQEGAYNKDGSCHVC